LLSNALKYTSAGKVLLGCRRCRGILSIEVWDTGVGIPDGELEAVFEEYHQLDNAARERSRGLGLGLSIVQRLGNLLGHPVRVRSRSGKGSAFAIEAALPPDGPGRGSMPLDRRLPAGNGRAGIAQAAKGPPPSGDHDHEQQRCGDRGSSHQGGRFRLHRGFLGGICGRMREAAHGA
jgi:hypothetical protein